MKKIKMNSFLLVIFLFSITNNLIAENGGFVIGKDYEITAPSSNSEPLVEEFFNYACPHCYSMETFVNDFKEKNPDIKVEMVPVELRPAWKIYVKAYYLGEKLGVLDKSHSLIFYRVNVEKKHFKNEADMKSFFLSLGVDEEVYDEVATSYWLDTKLRLAKQYAMKNKVMGTPAFLVNKRYKLNNEALASFERISQAMVEFSGYSKP